MRPGQHSGMQRVSCLSAVALALLLLGAVGCGGGDGGSPAARFGNDVPATRFKGFKWFFLCDPLRTLR